jgi:hypothetical protein
MERVPGYNYHCTDEQLHNLIYRINSVGYGIDLGSRSLVKRFLNPTNHHNRHMGNRRTDPRLHSTLGPAMTAYPRDHLPLVE